MKQILKRVVPWPTVNASRFPRLKHFIFSVDNMAFASIFLIDTEAS